MFLQNQNLKSTEEKSPRASVSAHAREREREGEKESQGGKRSKRISRWWYMEKRKKSAGDRIGLQILAKT
jgi:hypothetical protein